MTDLIKATKFIERQIESLEHTTYMFENIIKPRYEADKRILDALREQHLKLSALQEKVASGQEVTTDEIYASVPGSFR